LEHDEEVPLLAVVPLVVLAVVIVGGTLVGRRRGYNLGGNVIVRCQAGHLFTTIWVPGVSLKAVRLVWVRLQRCPVGDHWTFVTPVRESDLTDEERWFAEKHHDVWMP
jgi:hypothetical protein